jgi:integrase
MSLTDTAIKRLKPTGKDAFHADSNGVYLRVAVSGSKTFLYRSRSGGVARWVTLGVYPTLTLADARAKAVALSTGMLPSHITVRTVYDEWILHIRKTYKSPLQVEQRMATHFLPKFESQKTSSVTRAQLSSLLTELAATSPVQANRLLTNIKLMFAYAVERGWLDNSPAEVLTRKTAGGKEKSRERVLTSAELTALMQELTGERFGPAIRYALVILLVSGQRSGEVRGLVRDELRVDGWHIPPYRTKNGTACSVLLPNACIRLIRCAVKDLGNEPFKGMDRQQLARAVKRMGVTWTPHDLRRTMATKMADLGVAPHVIEKCLNHTMGGVMAIYNRSEYATEKKAAWRLWVRYLLAQRKGPQ